MPFKHLTPELVLAIYSHGAFPMAESADSEEFEIYEARERSLLPFEKLHVPHSLKKHILKNEYDIRVNTSFEAVITACGETNTMRDETWINSTIRDVFIELHKMGHAHSVEAWKDGELAGGLYGLQIGSAFCGESMFSRATDASKIALVHLCARLKKTGFTLLDAQLNNPHLDQFGQILVSQADYLTRLNAARTQYPDFGDIDISEQELVINYLLY